MDLRAALISIHRGLVAREVDHALIGGLALSVHGAGRATTDLDWIADGHRAERVDDLLRAEGYQAIHRSDWAGNYLSDDPVKGRIDFFFVRRSGIAILGRASEHSVLGETVPVADRARLLPPVRVRGRPRRDPREALAVSRSSRDVEDLRDDLGSPAAREALAASEREVDAWERAHPTTLEGVLDWIDQLRLAFGDRPPDRTPWRGDRILID
jgi:hypothetical protein